MSTHTISTCPQCGQEMHPTDYHARLQAINAELLAACTFMMERTIGGELTPYQRQRARAAIAKATS